MTSECPTRSFGRPWWAATIAVAATYVYFLLFAEFALLELMRPLAGSTGSGIQKVMLTLGSGGLAGCLFGAWRFRPERLEWDLTTSFLAAALAALATLGAPSFAFKLAAVAAVGGSLGWLTVTLATGLRGRIGVSHLGRAIGAGTGLAYAICNLPIVFNAAPSTQAVLAAVVVTGGSLAVPFLRPPEPAAAPSPDHPSGRKEAWRWILIFLALVWLDSAAFYIIQHHPEWRSATWSGADRLGFNAIIHLGAALVAGRALDRGALRSVVAIGLAALVAACAGLALRTPHYSWVQLGYTAGVSFYSVALVFYPASQGRPWLTAAIFAVAGWIGSALGIGMAQDLQHIPLLVVTTAGVAGVTLLARRPRLAAGLAAAMCVGTAVPRTNAATESLIDRGRAVYIAEGCIHCHSQYLRRGTLDIDRWGEAPPFAAAVAGTPPLLGNRRQGPDLATVGRRRTPEWNRLHLMHPRQVSPGSRMPSYAHLFRPGGGNSAGEALVAYLGSLGTRPPAEVPIVAKR